MPPWIGRFARRKNFIDKNWNSRLDIGEGRSQILRVVGLVAHCRISVGQIENFRRSWKIFPADHFYQQAELRCQGANQDTCGMSLCGENSHKENTGRRRTDCS